MTALANNIILFPKSNSRLISPQSIDEINDNVETVKQVHIQETLETVMPMMFDRLAMIGFQPDDDADYLKDGALIVESVRSFLSKTYGISHPLQFFAEHMFDQVDEDGTLEVSDRIKLIVTPTEGQG